MYNLRMLIALLIAAIFAPRVYAQAPASPTTRDSNLPVLWIVGDSTVKNNQRGQVGWGAPIACYFDAEKIRVENRARGGRSSRTYITEGLWDQVLAEARGGDFVLIQFGHNDGAPIDDAKARGSLRGVGDETRDIIHPATQKPETVHTFGWYLRKYISDAGARGVTPIVCSLIPHAPREPVQWPLKRREMHAAWAREVAESEGVAFIDLNAIVLEKYSKLDPQRIKTDYFTEADNTHTSAAGAELNAAAVVEGLRALINHPLAKFLRTDAGAP